MGEPKIERHGLGSTRDWIYSVARNTARLSDRAIVFFSGGKDATVMLDLCVRHFKRVDAIFMYFIPDLAYQERHLAVVEQFYGIRIHRAPHWALSHYLYEGLYRWHSKESDTYEVDIGDTEEMIRERTGSRWCAHGFKMTDSLERRGIIRGVKGIDTKFRRFYPVAGFTDKMIMDYIRWRRLPLAPEYRWGLKRSAAFPNTIEELAAVKKHAPDDYEKVIGRFPFLKAIEAREEFYGSGEASEV
jgi:phosphoadenosine phosphosulfate reductase